MTKHLHDHPDASEHQHLDPAMRAYLEYVRHDVCECEGQLCRVISGEILAHDDEGSVCLADWRWVAGIALNEMGNILDAVEDGMPREEILNGGRGRPRTDDDEPTPTPMPPAVVRALDDLDTEGI